LNTLSETIANHIDLEREAKEKKERKKKGKQRKRKQKKKKEKQQKRIEPLTSRSTVQAP
jgi:hypothetical protein